MTKKRYQTYQDNMLLPFISKTWSEFGGWVEGSPIPEDLRAVSWCDGDLAQIDNIVSNKSLQIYSTNTICANKQSAVRSGVEQPADLTKTFKIMHKLQSEVTVSHVLIKNHPLKRMIHQQLKVLTFVGKLVLKPTKKNTLVDSQKP